MKDSFVEAGTTQVNAIRHINRDLLEKALQMRCLSYLSHVKSLLLTETIYEIDQSKKYVQNINYQLIEQRQTIERQKQELESRNLELQHTKDQLEDLVRQRTIALKDTNKALKKEIQERKQIESALRDSETVFRSLLQSAPDAIVIVNECGVIDLVNEQTVKLFGYSESELIGQPVEVLIPSGQRKIHEEYRESFFSKSYCRLMGEGIELRAQTKSGALIPVEVALSPLKTQKGLLVTAAIRDISKRKQVEAELINYRDHLEELVADRTAALSTVNKELEEFSYTISHDLRAPLRSIDGFSLALLEDCEDQLSADAKHYLKRIRSAAQRMGHLIDEVLDLARVSRCDLHKNLVDLTKMAKEIIADLQLNEPVRNVSVKVGKGLYAKADEALLRVVLENLLDNAWKFTARKEVAEIIFDIKQNSDKNIFFVQDNGAGLDMQYVSKLFGPFQRLHSHSEFPGTGVGLATVKRIIQRHGGRIWVDSELDKGTIFYFTLDH